VDLADVVDRSKPRTRPLYIYFGFGPQCGVVHAFLHTDVGKDWLDNGDLLALFGIDLGLHFIDQVGLLRIHRDGKIPVRGGGFAQTALLQRTGGAVFRAGLVDLIGAIAVGLAAGMTGQFLDLRTATHLFDGIEREVRCREKTCPGVGLLPAVDAILEALLPGNARIAFAELDVGDGTHRSFRLCIPANF
jgi:hypothetical protein